MTDQEKKMNKEELVAFKSGRAQLKSMVPGIHNLQTIGSSPMQRIQQAYAQGSPLYTSSKMHNMSGASPRDLLEQSTQAYLRSNRLQVRGYEEHDVKESIY